MEHVLITGGGGYIGTILAEHLLAEGHRVTLFDRFFFGLNLLEPLIAHERLHVVRGDVRSIDARTMRDVTCVMHLAGLSNDPCCDLDAGLTEDINLNGTLRTAEAARKAGVPRFIFSSSCSVYGAGENSRPMDEQAPTNPVSLYAQLKLAAEQELMTYADDFCLTMLRNATVYGSSYRMRFDLVINLMALYASRDHKVFVLGGGRQWRPLLHVHDIARAFTAVMEAPADRVRGEIFNVGSNDQTYQVAQLASIICEVVPNTVIEHAPDDPDKRSYRVDFTRLARTLNFAPTRTPRDGAEEIHKGLTSGTIADTIRTRTVAFYRYLIEAEELVRELSLNGSILGPVPAPPREPVRLGGDHPGREIVEPDATLRRRDGILAGQPVGEGSE